MIKKNKASKSQRQRSRRRRKQSQCNYVFIKILMSSSCGVELLFVLLLHPLLLSHKDVWLHVDKGPMTQAAAKQYEKSVLVFDLFLPKNRSSRTRRQRLVGYSREFHGRNSLFSNDSMRIALKATMWSRFLVVSLRLAEMRPPGAHFILF